MEIITAVKKYCAGYWSQCDGSSSRVRQVLFKNTYNQNPASLMQNYPLKSDV